MLGLLLRWPRTPPALTGSCLAPREISWVLFMEDPWEFLWLSDTETHPPGFCEWKSFFFFFKLHWLPWGFIYNMENPRDGGAWWAAVCGVARSQTRLKQLSSSSSIYVFVINFLILNALKTLHLYCPWKDSCKLIVLDFLKKANCIKETLKKINSGFNDFQQLKKLPTWEISSKIITYTPYPNKFQIIKS